MNELFEKLRAAKKVTGAIAAREKALKLAEMEAIREKGRKAVDGWLDRADPQEILKTLEEAARCASENRWLLMEIHASKFCFGEPVLDKQAFGEGVLARLLEIHTDFEASLQADQAA